MGACARAVQQPDGSFLLAIDPTVTDLSTCPYVVALGSESWSLGALSINDAQAITGSIVLLWAIAWGFRQVANSLTNFNSERSQDE